MKRLIVIACLSGFLLPSCGLFKKRPKVVLQNKMIRMVGRVERVENQSGYVLIRRYGPWRFDPATEVTVSRSGERSANLFPSGEKLGEHIAADIRSGKVEVGDAVYIRKIKASKRSEISADQDKPGDPNNQDKAVSKPEE